MFWISALTDARKAVERLFPSSGLLQAVLFRRRGRERQCEPHIHPVRTILRYKLPVGFHINDALDLVRNGEKIVDLRANASDLRFKRA
jgi:hypothetical protein